MQAKVARYERAEIDITLRAAPVGSTARPRPEQRLRLGARIFTILAVAERDATGRYLVCFSREEVPA